MSLDIERSNEYYYKKGKEEAAAEFAKLHAAHVELQQRFDLEHTRMSSHIHRLEDRMFAMERFVECREQEYRAPNLIVQGLPEAPNVEEKVQEIFPKVHPQRILEVVRLGKPREAGQRPRPVLVRFASAGVKHEGLKEARALRAKRIYLDTHLTPRQMAVKQAKASRFRQLRDEGAKPFWRGELLYHYRK